MHSGRCRMIRPAPLATVIAHRGASGDAPENTLAALDLAADQGAAAVEVDVAISADGVPFLHHDDALERCTSGRGLLCDHDAVDIDRLHAAKRYPGHPHEPVPRLSVAIELLIDRQLAFNLEIKPTAGLEQRTTAAICETIERAWPTHQSIVFSSFSEAALTHARARLPDVPRALISDQVPDNLDALVDTLGLRNLHCAASDLQPAGIQRVKRAGLGLYCYTVNESARAIRLVDLGVDGVFTDYPARLLARLALASGGGSVDHDG